MADDPPSREVTDEAFWRAGGGFAWRRPRFNVYKPADKRPRAMLNRYPHNVIGAAVVVFGRCWVLNWKGTPKRKTARAALGETP